MEKIEKPKGQVKSRLWKGIGWKTASLRTKEGELIEGITFFAFHLKVFTFTVADSPWVNEQKKPYRIALDNGVLYLHKFAMSFF